MDSGRDNLGVTSPFGQVSARMPVEGSDRARFPRWIAVGLGGLVLALAGGYLGWRTLSDPLRTLPMFPTEKYFAGYNALSGASFKADLRVDADLGWQDGVGRLLVFTAMNDTGAANKLAVLIPAEIAGILFDKNQAYRVELEVREGGVIRAKSFKKL